MIWKQILMKRTISLPIHSMIPFVANVASQLDTWMTETGDMGETPESSEIMIYWDENMAESFKQSMEKRGLSPDISDADYVAWWEKHLL